MLDHQSRPCNTNKANPLISKLFLSQENNISPQDISPTEALKEQC